MSTPSINRRIAFSTLGCRLNQFEIDALATEFLEAGYTVVADNQEADAYIINTCTVTNKSDQKSRNLINSSIRRHSGKVHVVTGCFVNQYKEQLEEHSEITYVVDNERKRNIFSLVHSHFEGHLLHPTQLPKDKFSYSVPTQGLRTRGAVKIHDGCDNFCTFCIIPFVRGRAASRPTKEIIQDVAGLVDSGIKEVVLTGVNIARYNDAGIGFTELLEQVLEVPGDFRIRISSLEPDQLDDRFIDLFENPKLAPHLHLCLQSGSDKILLGMRRMYTLATYRRIVENLRSRYHDFSLTTDLMTGFPGETEEDHKDSIKAISEFAIHHVHTFKYSKRAGTRAERMPNQIPEQLKKTRSEEIRIAAHHQKLQHRKAWLGKKQRMLIEKIVPTNSIPGKGPSEKASAFTATGYGEHYIPLVIESNTSLWTLKPNTFVDVVLTEIIEDESATVRAELS